MTHNYKLLIKGMVCERCILIVKRALEKLGCQIIDIKLGEVTVLGATTPPDMIVITQKLSELGFELIADKGTKVVNFLKELIEEVYSGNFDFSDKFRFSTLVESRSNENYETLSAVFSEKEKISLEKYVILFRIEKIKEYLIYTKEPIADIAYWLGFSSVAHLSQQFKAHTGLNPSHFRIVRKDKLLMNP